MLPYLRGKFNELKILQNRSNFHGAVKPPSKGLIKATFTYLLHFFSFLDQTCQIDYGCWPNDSKFLFDSNVKFWRHKGWRHQNGQMEFLISKSNLYHLKVFRTGVKPRKPFLATARKTRVTGLQRNLIAPPEPYFSLKNDPSDIFFTVVCKISWFSGDTNFL